MSGETGDGDGDGYGARAVLRSRSLRVDAADDLVRGAARPPGQSDAVHLRESELTHGAAYTLDFEKPLLELEKQIEELKRVGGEREIDVDGELEALESQAR